VAVRSRPGGTGVATPTVAQAMVGLPGKFQRVFARSQLGFEVRLPDGSIHKFGGGAATFRVELNDAAGVRALASADEGRIGDAYLEGHLDIQGDMLKPFELRKSMGDFHPLLSAWRFLQPSFLGQVRTNKRAIQAHYDIDPEFFMSFLDPMVPCYTHGLFTTADEPLEVANRRKLDYCFEKLRLAPGNHILEIGPGWGAWIEHATRRGVRCTGITISEASRHYLEERSRELRLPWRIIDCDLLDYESDTLYDAIVIMGVIEHLPQYARVLAKFQSLLKPGGLIYLDASASERKYELSSFMVKHIYGGNHSFLVLHDFLEKMARTPFRVHELYNDRLSYFFTFQCWARNFERNAADVINRFGEFNYRRFRLYLWGAAYEFLSRSLDCYRMVIGLPAESGTTRTD
jgi:cyclopropane-fatty-acyl-phospholipid synthase